VRNIVVKRLQCPGRGSFSSWFSIVSCRVTRVSVPTVDRAVHTMACRQLHSPTQPFLKSPDSQPFPHPSPLTNLPEQEIPKRSSVNSRMRYLPRYLAAQSSL